MVDLSKPRRGSITTFTITGGNQAVASPSEKRRCIAFIVSPATSAGAINTRPMVSISDGPNNGTDIDGVPIRYEDYGDLVCKAWYYFGQSAAGTISVLEGFEI